MSAAELLALNYFSNPKTISFDMETGVLQTKGGTRLCAVNRDFLRGFVGACVHEAGPAAHEIFLSCGRHFGKRLAARMEKEIGEHAKRSVREFEMYQFDGVLREMWRAFGMGDVEFDWKRGRELGAIPVSLSHSPMLGVHIEEDKRDAMMAGLLEGFVNHFSAVELTCIQTLSSTQSNETEEKFVLVQSKHAKTVSEWVGANQSHHEVLSKLVTLG
ncbi:MAG: hypothetical protein AAFQ82_00655 [Myxococcota bacterium]